MGERAKATSKAPESKSENSPSQTKKTNFSQSINSPIDQILFLQRTVGNHAVEKLLKSGFIQAKLTIGQPGDIYEQEADRVAEQVMRMPDPSTAGKKGVSEYKKSPSIQRMCTECDEELQRQILNSELGYLELGSSSQEELQRQPIEEDEELLQTKETSGIVPEVSSAVESQISSIRGGGQPLPESVRAFFEPRFGHDFSEVRLHTDANAARSAMAIHARAYTVGRDVVFADGQFSSATAKGRELLAHELSHTIQQGAAVRRQVQSADPQLVTTSTPSLHPTIQRAMGFEFQTKNKMTTNKGKAFPRKFPKEHLSFDFFHKGKSGVVLETDTGSIVEFATDPFRKWSELKAQIQEAVNIVGAIKKTPKTFPFSQETLLKNKKLLEKEEKLEVDIKDKKFVAAIQSTEGITLPQYESFLKEHEKPEFVDPVIARAQRILDAAKKADKKLKPGTKLHNLIGFLQVIVNYIQRGQEILSSAERVSPVKARFRLMHRTNFSSMFSSLLGPDEKRLFKQIVSTNAIPKELGIAATDQLFQEGYWGHFGGMFVLFSGGEIVALAKSEDKKVIHECSSKAKTEGIDVSKCGKKVPESDITVGAWLNSIVNAKKDLLSHPFHGSESMGKFDVRTEGEEKGLAIFETRGYEMRDRSRPADDWVGFAEHVFQWAAFCRGRPGTPTELEYDGSTPFDISNCLQGTEQFRSERPKRN